MENKKKIYGIVYKTTCLVNGKVYIGQHTRGDESYLGSGTAINESIKFYSRKNFRRNTLVECYSQEELNQYEELFIELYNSTDRKFGYNLASGVTQTKHHEDSITKLKNSLRIFYESPKGLERKKWMSEFGNLFADHKHKQESLDKISKSLLKHYNSSEGEFTKIKLSNASKGENNPMFNKEHSEESKKKMSEARKNYFNGEEGDKNKQELSKKKLDFYNSDAGNLVKEKLRKSRLDFYNSEDGKKLVSKIFEKFRGENHWCYGKHHTEESKKKISDAQKGEKNHNYGKVTPQSVRDKLSKAYKDKSDEQKELESLKKSLNNKLRYCNYDIFFKIGTEEEVVFYSKEEALDHFMMNKSQLIKLMSESNDFTLVKKESCINKSSVPTHTKESRMKISEALKGRSVSELRVKTTTIGVQLKSGCNNIVYAKGTEHEYTFTSTEEAMEYFGISYKSLRELIVNNKDFTLVKVRSKNK